MASEYLTQGKKSTYPEICDLKFSSTVGVVARFRTCSFEGVTNECLTYT